jgi:hypothetical protein
MPLGSSSAAPVISPGPSRPMPSWTFRRAWVTAASISLVGWSVGVSLTGFLSA